MFRKFTGTLSDSVMLCAITNSLRSVPTSNGIVMFRIGIVSLAHFMPSGLFQSKLLFNLSSNFETFRFNVSHQDDDDDWCYLEKLATNEGGLIMMSRGLMNRPTTTTKVRLMITINQMLNKT